MLYNIYGNLSAPFITFIGVGMAAHTTQSKCCALSSVLVSAYSAHKMYLQAVAKFISNIIIMIFITVPKVVYNVY